MFLAAPFLNAVHRSFDGAINERSHSMRIARGVLVAELDTRTSISKMRAVVVEAADRPR